MPKSYSGNISKTVSPNLKHNWGPRSANSKIQN